MADVSLTQKVAEADEVEQLPYGALFPHPSSQEYSGELQALSRQNLMLPRSDASRPARVDGFS